MSWKTRWADSYWCVRRVLRLGFNLVLVGLIRLVIWLLSLIIAGFSFPYFFVFGIFLISHFCSFLISMSLDLLQNKLTRKFYYISASLALVWCLFVHDHNVMNCLLTVSKSVWLSSYPFLVSIKAAKFIFFFVLTCPNSLCLVMGNLWYSQDVFGQRSNDWSHFVGLDKFLGFLCWWRSNKSHMKGKTYLIRNIERKRMLIY